MDDDDDATEDGSSWEIDELIKELLSEDFDVVDGDSGIGTKEDEPPVPSTNGINSNQGSEATTLEQNYQVDASYATTLNTSSDMHRNSKHTSVAPEVPVRQSSTGTSPTMFKESPQVHNTVPQLHQQQLSQHQERPDIHPLPVQSNVYLIDSIQHRLTEVEEFCQGKLTSYIMLRRQELQEQYSQVKPEKHLEQISPQPRKEQLLKPQTLSPPQYLLSNLQASSSQSQNLTLVDQLEYENQIKILHNSPSPDSISRVRSTNSMAWVDSALQQILFLKELFLPRLLKHQSTLLQKRLQATNQESLTRCEMVLGLTKRVVKFLQQSRHGVMRIGKEDIFRSIMVVSSHLHELFVGRNSFPQQVEATSNHFKTPKEQQRGTPTSLLEAARQLSDSSLEKNSVDSSEVSLSPGVQNVNVLSYRARQGYVVSSPFERSQIDVDQRGLNLPSSGISQHNSSGTLPQKVASSWNNSDPFNSSASPNTRNSALTSSPINICQDQAITTQHTVVQMSLDEENLRQTVEKENEVSKLRHFPGCNKISPFLVPPIPSPSHAVSPQDSQQSSMFSKFAAPSPSAVHSTLNPLTPIAIPLGSEKSSLSLEKSSKLPKTSASPVQLPFQDIINKNLLVMVPQGVPNPPLFKESTDSGHDASSNAKEPINRLVEVGKSMSSTALKASSRELESAITISDGICRDSKRGKARKIYSANMELVASDGMKRQKREVSDQLLKEIKEINKNLIEVNVDVMNVKDDFRPGSEEGTRVKVAYCPIGLTQGNHKTFPYLRFELIVKTDYPHSSPIICENLPPDSSRAEEDKKARSYVHLRLRKSPEPLSLTEIVKAWYSAAREGYREFALRTGGGDFSSHHGKWTNFAGDI